MAAHVVPATIARAVLKGAVTLAVRRPKASKPLPSVGDDLAVRQGEAFKTSRPLADGQVVATARIDVNRDGVLRVQDGRSGGEPGGRVARVLAAAEQGAAGDRAEALRTLAQLAGYRDWAELATKLVGRSRRVTLEVVGWVLK